MAPTAQAFPVSDGSTKKLSDSEALAEFGPCDERSLEVNRYIVEHPICQALRVNPAFTESRPHVEAPEEFRMHSLVGKTLAGAGKLVVPPFFWTEEGGKSLVSISYLGADLCGHPGIIHGGLLATMLDEGLAMCCCPALPNKAGFTASMTLNYRKPAFAGSYVVLRAKTVKVEGRKAWAEGHIETLTDEGKEPDVLVEASALFVDPKKTAPVQ